MPRDIQARLSAPFNDSDIEWRLQSTNREKTSGKAVPYVTNRAIQNRLDDVVEVDCWKNEYIPWHSDGKKASQICGISIYFADRKEWITKYDGAEDSDIEPVKGGLSDSMKRAAVQWGVGRYLYQMDTVSVDVEIWNDKPYIKRGEQAKMDRAHQKIVQQIFGSSQLKAPVPEPKKNTPVQFSAPKGLDIQPPATLPQPVPAQAPRPQAETSDNSYCVMSTAVQPSMNGQNTLLQLKGADEKTILAYMQGTNPAVIPGIWIENAVITQRIKEGVVFHTLNAFDLADPKAA